MLVSMNWIQDFVDLSGLDIENLIHRFTLSTAEVEDIFFKGKELNKIIVARVEEVKDHPESKKLHLLKVNTGTEIKDCVCGAPNVREGMMVAFACVGGFVNGMEITAAKIAGYVSEGMCCSGAELGISSDDAGIIEIPDEIALGTDIKEAYEIDDIIFEVDNKSLTNRPDLWGHYGIAREFAAIAGRKLNLCEIEDIEKYNNLPELDIKIEEPELAYRYSGMKIENIKVKKSPLNMQIRLHYCGMRPLNLLADLTNYLMLELGQPMHAFDSSKVDRISVKCFENPFQFTTLDNNQRNIEKDMLMICCGETPVAVAGVMGGFDSEITDSTQGLLLESANFNGVSVRKTSTALGLRTDASMRYEKVLDPELTELAVKRFLFLLKNIDKNITVSSRFTDTYVYKYDIINIKIDKKYINRYTGIEISDDEIIKTLEALGFAVKYSNGEFNLTVPSWRATKDVTIKADIVEEITRIYGYDNFKIDTAVSPLYPVRKEIGKTDEYYAKEILVEKYNINEVHSYIWCDSKKFKRLGIVVEPNVTVVNSIMSENDCIRNCLIPALLFMIEENKMHAEDFGIFEIAMVVEGLKENGECNERKKLGIVLFSREKSEEELFFKMKEILNVLCENLKHDVFEYSNADKCAHEWQHPVNNVNVGFKGREIGYFSTLHPFNQQKIDKKAAIVAAQIDMAALAGHSAKDFKYDEPSKFPGIEIDLSVIVNGQEEGGFARIEQECRKVDNPYLKKISVIDIYYDGQQRSVTFRQYFSSNEKTLNMDEIQKYMDVLIERLAAKGFELKK